MCLCVYVCLSLDFLFSLLYGTIDQNCFIHQPKQHIYGKTPHVCIFIADSSKNYITMFPLMSGFTYDGRAIEYCGFVEFQQYGDFVLLLL